MVEYSGIFKFIIFWIVRMCVFCIWFIARYNVDPLTDWKYMCIGLYIYIYIYIYIYKIILTNVMLEISEVYN